MANNYNQIIRYDGWLSSKLGYKAYHLSEDFTEIDLLEIKDESFFIDAKIDISSFDRIYTLNENKFKLADTNIQLTKKDFNLEIEGSCCRFSVTRDKEAIANIAQSCFTKSRFHRDPLISVKTANTIKADWTRGFFEGNRGDWMIVAEEQNVICGFLQLINSPSLGLIIDLIGVHRDYQGKSYGSRMIAFAIKNCTTEKKEICVGTQLCNTLSLNFYQRLGFFIESAKYVFHLHR